MQDWWYGGFTLCDIRLYWVTTKILILAFVLAYSSPEEFAKRQTWIRLHSQSIGLRIQSRLLAVFAICNVRPYHCLGVIRIADFGTRQATDNCSHDNEYHLQQNKQIAKIHFWGPQVVVLSGHCQWNVWRHPPRCIFSCGLYQCVVNSFILLCNCSLKVTPDKSTS